MLFSSTIIVNIVLKIINNESESFCINCGNGDFVRTKKNKNHLKIAMISYFSTFVKITQACITFEKKSLKRDKNIWQYD